MEITEKLLGIEELQLRGGGIGYRHFKSPAGCLCISAMTTRAVTKQDAALMQSLESTSDGVISEHSLAAHLQAAAEKNEQSTESEEPIRVEDVIRQYHPTVKEAQELQSVATEKIGPITKQSLVAVVQSIAAKLENEHSEESMIVENDEQEQDSGGLEDFENLAEESFDRRIQRQYTLLDDPTDGLAGIYLTPKSSSSNSSPFTPPASRTSMKSMDDLPSNQVVKSKSPPLSIPKISTSSLVLPMAESGLYSP